MWVSYQGGFTQRKQAAVQENERLAIAASERVVEGNTCLLSVSLTAMKDEFLATSMPLVQQLPLTSSHGQLG